MVFKIYKKSLILIIVIFFILILFLFSLEKKKIITNFYFLKSNSACFKNNINSGEDKYRNYEIIIAGHSYGRPAPLVRGTYTKFLNYLNQNLINKQDFFILAGDIARKANRQNFKIVKKEIMKFSKKIIIAPGNHDVGTGPNSKERKQFIQEFKKTYDKLFIKNNLFFVLDSNINPYNITEDQIYFIKKVLENYKNLENIFIITHHVIWYNYISKDIITNNKGRDVPSNINFENVLDLFKDKKVNNGIFFIAGDVGRFENVTKIFCEKANKIKFIATGMGSGKNDNFLKIKISEGGELISIYPIIF